MVDPKNPLHQASFYVEALKYGPGPRAIEGVTADQFKQQFETMLRDADKEDLLTYPEFMEAVHYYGLSSSRGFGVPELQARSIWADGLMHGFALATGLSMRREDLDVLENAHREI